MTALVVDTDVISLLFDIDLIREHLKVAEQFAKELSR